MPNTGLEISLQVLAFSTQAQQVVRWNQKIIMKDFSRLLVATRIDTGVILWRLVSCKNSEDRISYIDSRLDKMKYEYLLRLLCGPSNTDGT